MVFFAADLVVFFETDFLAAAMGPPFVGKSHMSQQEDYSIQYTIPSRKIDSEKIFYTTGAWGEGAIRDPFIIRAWRRYSAHGACVAND